MELIATHDGHGISFGAGSSINEAAAMPLLGLPKYFTCAFFLHNSDWSKRDLEVEVERILDAGAVYLQFHGKRCEEAESLADSLIIRRLGDRETHKNVILTTSHSDVDVEDMVFQTVLLGMPSAEDYADEWAGYLIISTGSPAENETVRQVFSNPQKSIELALDKNRR